VGLNDRLRRIENALNVSPDDEPSRRCPGCGRTALYASKPDENAQVYRCTYCLHELNLPPGAFVKVLIGVSLADL
jgi:hypothetical protein